MGPFIYPMGFFRQAPFGSIFAPMKDSRTDPQYKIRFTPELKSKLDKASEQSGRSLNGEILYRLQESFTPQVPPEFIGLAKSAGPATQVHFSGDAKDYYVGLCLLDLNEMLKSSRKVPSLEEQAEISTTVSVIESMLPQDAKEDGLRLRGAIEDWFAKLRDKPQRPERDLANMESIIAITSIWLMLAKRYVKT